MSFVYDAAIVVAFLLLFLLFLFIVPYSKWY